MPTGAMPLSLMMQQNNLALMRLPCRLCHVYCGLSNTPGNLLELFSPPGDPRNLLEIYKVSWKFSGLVCMFVSLILVTVLVFRSTSIKYLTVNRDQLILRLVISVSASITHLLIG